MFEQHLQPRRIRAPRRQRLQRDYDAPMACIPVLCKCVPRNSCQALFDDYVEWVQFKAWINQKDSPTIPADPLSNLRMRRSYDYMQAIRVKELEQE